MREENKNIKSFKLKNLLEEIIDKKEQAKKYPIIKPNLFNSEQKIYILRNNLNKNSNEIIDKTYTEINNVEKRKINKSSKKDLPQLKTSKSKNYFYRKNSDKTKFVPISNTLNYYGYNPLKLKTTKALIKMNNILLKKSVNNLSKPINLFYYITPLNKGKNKFKIISTEDFGDFDFKNSNNKNRKMFIFNYKKCFKSNSKSKKCSLYEREKVKTKRKYNQMIKQKFIELDSCEKKFDVVITKTLKKLNEAEETLFKFNN